MADNDGTAFDPFTTLDDQTVSTGDDATIDTSSEDVHTQADQTDQSQTTEDDGIPSDPDELRKGYLRQADYTRKTQDLATQRKEISALQAELLQLKTATLTQQQVKPAVEETPLPDPEKDPQGYVEAYVQQQVKQRLDAQLDQLGLRDLPDRLKPVLSQQSVVAAYQEFMEASPELDHNQLAGAVGQVIDGDQELSQLSQANPHLAVRLATRVAQADLDAKRQAASHKNRSR